MGIARIGLLILFGIGTGATARAAVTLDGTLGPAGMLTGPDYVIPDTVGQTRGANLFHSFGEFSLTSAESATFTGPASIQNVIGRVTGGAVSSIDGTIRSDIAGANLYLINPSGIVFGANAQLDVSGSFHASTADYLSLADGGRFDARNPGASLLTIAPPSAFGFLTAVPAALEVNGATLAAPAGGTLSLVGGDIRLVGSAPEVPTLLAPSGRVNVVAVAGAGEALIAPDDLQVDSFSALGELAMSNAAFIDTRGDPGGRIVIRAGRFVIDNDGGDFSQFPLHPALSAASTGAVDHPGTGIDIRVRGDMRVHAAEITASSFGAGRGGDIRVEADRLELFGAPPNADEPIGRVSVIASRVFGSGDSGNVAVAARELVLRDGAAIQTQVAENSGGTGTAGDIDITADRLVVSGDTGLAFVSSATFALGNAGNLRVTANEIEMRGGPAGFAGLTTQVAQSSQANASAGTLSVTAGRLSLLEGGQISAGIFSGTGTGGNVRVVADEITIAGRDANGFPAGIFSNVNNVATAGSAGDIEVVARNVRVAESGQIAASAGLTVGRAGNVTIDASNVTLSNGGIVTAQTFGTQDAGDIVITADTLRVAGPGPLGEFTGIFALAGINGGAGGDVRIRASDVQVLDGAVIDSSTSGAGLGGTIDIEADRVLVSGHDALNNRRAAIKASTFVFANFDFLATGQGGDVRIAAPTVTLRDGGSISVDSSSQGDGGNIRIDAGELRLTGGASLSATSSASGNAGNIEVFADSLSLRDSDISTHAAQADGGNVAIAASRLVHLHRSTLTASVGGGAGNGGNIVIDPDFVVLNHSRIAADAVGGNGGNVSIVAGQFLASPDSAVTASSVFGLQGEVVIRAPGDDIAGELQRLPETALDAASRFKSGCAPTGGRFSRFTAPPAGVAAHGVAALASDYTRIDANGGSRRAAYRAVGPFTRLARAGDTECKP